MLESLLGVLVISLILLLLIGLIANSIWRW